MLMLFRDGAIDFTEWLDAAIRTTAAAAEWVAASALVNIVPSRA
jgi:hypothetical protein